MTETLQAGPELDALVAEAIGITTKIHESKCHRVEPMGNPPMFNSLAPFSPSTDMNDAFEAARAIQRKIYDHPSDFGWDLGAYIGSDEKGWTCQIGDCSERAFVPGDFPALAICAAILKVKA